MVFGFIIGTDVTSLKSIADKYAIKLNMRNTYTSRQFI